MDFVTPLIKLATDLGPAIGIVGMLGIIGAAYMFRENNRLRKERNDAVEKKDIDLKDIAMKKDEDLKEANKQLLAFGQKSTDALLKVSYAIDKNTKSNDKLIEAVYTILRSNQTDPTKL